MGAFVVVVAFLLCVSQTMTMLFRSKVVQLLQRYQSNPTNTLLTIEDVNEVIPPLVTVCPFPGYNATVLGELGVGAEEISWEGEEGILGRRNLSMLDIYKRASMDVLDLMRELSVFAIGAEGDAVDCRRVDRVLDGSRASYRSPFPIAFNRLFRALKKGKGVGHGLDDRKGQRGSAPSSPPLLLSSSPPLLLSSSPPLLLSSSPLLSSFLPLLHSSPQPTEAPRCIWEKLERGNWTEKMFATAETGPRFCRCISFGFSVAVLVGVSSGRVRFVFDLPAGNVTMLKVFLDDAALGSSDFLRISRGRALEVYPESNVAVSVCHKNIHFLNRPETSCNSTPRYNQQRCLHECVEKILVEKVGCVVPELLNNPQPGYPPPCRTKAEVHRFVAEYAGVRRRKLPLRDLGCSCKKACQRKEYQVGVRSHTPRGPEDGRGSSLVLHFPCRGV
ncbi:unnamed protein product [Darwinula stevensoni]|uniref:Uncharacterized protein n=1 Tax=Darwinula stevensoni TaxID=69355 RepID=A0A7R8XBM4_9CRUS|nr:unnamed protein product [Darwinula stevensoni]CAG0887921.1 unnamed protein product [Darwinula stevensoni]